MISFEILGEVTAQQDDWAASLSRQQQHLLAALVLGKGAPVGRERLEEILWDSQAPYPEGGIKRVASEVRGELRSASPGSDLLPACHGGYRLILTPEQADVLRFRTRAAEARRASGPASGELMRQALREWGPDAAGLHGGHPLRGLPGQWADSTRHLLRTEYRDAVIHCLAHDMNRHDYGLALRECEQRAADDPQALHDEEFIELWMRAAASSGDPARAHTVFRRATVVADRVGEPLSVSLHQLDTDLGVSNAPPRATSSGEDAIAQPEALPPAAVSPDPTPAPAEGRTMTIIAHGGNAFGAQNGNVYYYEGADKHLPPPPAAAEGSPNHGSVDR